MPLRHRRRRRRELQRKTGRGQRPERALALGAIRVRVLARTLLRYGYASVIICQNRNAISVKFRMNKIEIRNVSKII